MDTIVDQYADALLNNAIGDKIKQANKLLLDNDVDDHLAMVETYINLSGEELEDTEIQDLIINRILLEVENLINEFGVGITTLNVRITPVILDTLLSIEHIDEIDQILLLCDEDGSPEEVLASILHFMHSDISEEEFQEQLEYVTPSLITRLETILNELNRNRRDEAVDKDQIKLIGTRINSFLSKNKAPRFSQLREEGYGLNFKLDIYLRQCIDSDDSIDLISNEFIVCSLASGKNGSDILVDIDGILENYLDEDARLVDVVQKTRSKVNQLGEI